MAISNIKATFPCEVEKAWKTVTSMDDFAWRGDLKNIQVLNDKQFVEYTKDGFATNFTTTFYEENKRWEFDMENENMKGHWVGVFSYENGETTIEFLEDVFAKKVWMKPLVGIYLKKQQSAYVEDLKRALEK